MKLGVAVLALLLLVFFRAPLGRALSSVASTLFRPVLSGGAGVGRSAGSLGAYFQSKKFLGEQNEELKQKVAELEGRIANYSLLYDENVKLKEIFERKGSRNLILAAIIGKPDRSPYDTLILDVGGEKLEVGDIVYAYGDTPIGKIVEVNRDTAKVVLFSSPGQKSEVLVSGKDIFMQIVGRGGGNFEMTLPREFTVEVDTKVQLPGLAPHTLATVVEILSDPRDAYQKALLISPANIQELKFVEIETSP